MLDWEVFLVILVSENALCENLRFSLFGVFMKNVLLYFFVAVLPCWGQMSLDNALQSVEKMRVYAQAMPDINGLVYRDEQYPSIKATVLYWAVLHNKLEVVQYLLEQGADPTVSTGCEGSALMAAAWYDRAYERDGKVLDVLIASGKGLEVKNKDGYTIFELAALRGDYSLVKKLLDAGVSVEIGRFGYTPLAKSINGGAINTTNILLQAGARITFLSAWLAFWGPYMHGSINYEHGKKVRAVVYQEAVKRIKKAVLRT